MTSEEGKSLGNKVVLAKLPREEFSRLQHYCELKGETINAAIRRLVMNEVDKPPRASDHQSEQTTANVMFDTNSFDKMLIGEIPIDLVKKSIERGYKYFITHIQTDELNNIPENKKEKRAQLVLFLAVVAPSLIPTESFVLGYSRIGYAKLGTAGYYEKLLNDNKSNVKDAIIGDTAIKNEFILVTEDDQFHKKVKSLGGKSLIPAEFIALLKKVTK